MTRHPAKIIIVISLPDKQHVILIICGDPMEEGRGMTLAIWKAGVPKKCKRKQEAAE